MRARVHRDGGVQWGYPVRFTLRIAEDGATLEGEAERGGAAARTSLKKVGTFVSMSAPTPQATMTRAVHQVDDEPWRNSATR